MSHEAVSNRPVCHLFYMSVTCFTVCPSRVSHLPRVTPGTLTRRSPPRLFTAAAPAGLRPAPESRSRGAYPHLLRSFTTRISFQLRLLPCFCSTHHVPLSPHSGVLLFPPA